jgi:DNA-binding transcriptional MocR family regulator
MSDDQQDLFKAETTWFHIFRTMFSSGDVKKIGPYAYTVYCAIKFHASFKTGESFPGHERIMEITGISRSQLKRVLEDLEEAGYLSVEKRGRKNHYMLREKVAIQDAHGRPAAVATWDYLPASIQEAVADLKNVLMTGNFNGAQIVNIQHLTLNVNNGAGTQINLDMSKVTDDATKNEFKDILRRAARQAEVVVIHDRDDEDFQQ